MAAASDGEMEHEFETPGPGKRVLLLRSAPLAEPGYSARQHRRQGTIVVLSDITAIRHLSDMKSEYVSTVSHELRSPLTVIKASASTLESSIDEELPQELERQLLGAITRQSDRLLRMINDLLDAARLEAGHELRIDVAEHDLVSVLDEMVSDYRHSGELDGHVLEFEAEDSVPSLPFDRERVQQIVANLISNAVKYSPDGGTVRVSVEHQNGFAVVSVSDEGIGIPEEDLPRLFGRYHRCDTVHHREIKGTGLGLYITRALVEAHGGWIKAESELGKGSTFRFGLPIQPSAASS